MAESEAIIADEAGVVQQDSSVTKAEKNEKRLLEDVDEPAVKRIKTDIAASNENPPDENTQTESLDHGESVDRRAEFKPPTSDDRNGERKKGVAPIKAEYLVDAGTLITTGDEGGGHRNQDDSAEQSGKKGKKQKAKGQNTNRTFGSSKDAIPLCASRAKAPEFSPKECSYGEKCKYGHDLRRYLRDGKRPDLDTFEGRCPIFDARGWCSAGWKCRFAKAHSIEKVHEDGRKELVLVGEDPGRQANYHEEESGFGIVNVVAPEERIELRKRRHPTQSADTYTAWLNKLSGEGTGEHRPSLNTEVEDQRATFTDPPFLASEKRRIFYSAETPILAPLTTQGNLPFRRLCVELGAQVTWSEMAMGLPLLQGERGEWALMKAHESELSPPRLSTEPVVKGYDHAKDLKFGVQIAGNKPWVALKATQVLTDLCPHLRAVDLNCGCPIDLVYHQGAGSALLDNPAKLEKILRGMNAVSGEVPVTAKIRTGTQNSRPTADRLIKRLAFGGPEAEKMGHGPPGVAAITLHGRSRQQRYTKSADWSYIAECAALVENYNKNLASLTDTVREPDERLLPSGGLYFVGNGDCYSHEDYYSHIQSARVDSVMVARGALIKPWIFEEIEKQQYLDKSATERLQYVEKFARYGLETWGSDEVGVGTTRRFLLEWLSFSCRYVPIGLLEHLPPRIQDRPPAYTSRNDLESLLASDNFRDWIKISEMFLGPAHKDFHFEPKHKSNSYDTEG